MSSSHLRPIERRITSLAADGLSPVETGKRFRRSGDYIEQVLRLAEIPRRDARPGAAANALRPLERRLLRWRDEGVDHTKVAAMFHRSPEHIERVLALADYKQRSTS